MATTTKKPSLQLLVGPSSSPPKPTSAYRRVTSWGSAYSDTGSQFSLNADLDMSTLPSPFSVGGSSYLDSTPSAWPSQHRREFSGGSDSSSQSGAHSKTASFFSDFERSGGALSPPPNPPSRSNSLASSHAKGAKKSWLDVHPSGESDPSRRPRAESLGARPSRPPAIPPLPSLPSSSDLSRSTPYPFDTSPRPSRQKPSIPVIQTDLGRSTENLSLESPQSSVQDMSQLPTAHPDSVSQQTFSRGARFIDLKPPSRFGTLNVHPNTSRSRSSFLNPLSLSTSSVTSTSIPDEPMRGVTPSPSGECPEPDDSPPPENGEMLGPYRVEGTLGKGSFSTVALARWKGKKKAVESHYGDAPAGVNEDQLVALKLISRTSYDGNERMKISVVREVEVLKRIHHPSLVSLIHSFSTPRYAVLVLDYAAGGELFDLIATSHSTVSEPLARRIFGELCLAVGWMHSIFLVHRDIKLENILLTVQPTPSNASSLVTLPTPLVKLTDFGLSRFVSSSSPLLATRCGSEAYAAPELILGRKYDGRKTDSWALGVVLYALITSGMPFVEEPERRGRKGYLIRIAKGEYRWPSTLSSPSPSPTTATATTGTLGEIASPVDESLFDSTRLVTDAVKDVVARCLTRDPERRAAVDELWDAEWLHGDGRPERLEGWVSPQSEGQRDPLEEAWQRVEE